jgi:hypothetical protein
MYNTFTSSRPVAPVLDISTALPSTQLTFPPPLDKKGL